ncbi:MAG: gamma-glutamylcyclotransferase family protein [Polyangiaceae bacterium]
MKRALYFAYGSNLSEAQMRARCPDARPAGRAALRGYRLAFAGYSELWGGAVATLAPDPKGRVRGILYEVTAADLDALDRWEGHPHYYRRVRATVTDGRRRDRRVHLYVMTPERALGEPAMAYLTALLRAYLALGFDIEGLLRAARGRDR